MLDNVENVLIEKIPFLKESKHLELIKILIQKLVDGDPLLIVEWCQAQLDALSLANPIHTKNSLIANILANNDVINEANSNYIFSFRSFSDIEHARRNIPVWSKSLGPGYCEVTHINPVPPACAKCHVIIGTNRLVPDIAPINFFQMD